MPGFSSGDVRWVCPVRNRADEGHFRDEISIGRASDNDIVLDHDSASKHHAQLLRTKDSFQLTDLNSRNGTSLNGLPLTPYTAVVVESGHILGFSKLIRAAFYSSEEFWTRIMEEGADPLSPHGT